MVGSVGNMRAADHSAMRAVERNTSSDTPKSNSKSQEAIGHLAKAAILDAAGDSEMPKNVQGKVASALARGLELDTILNLQGPSEADIELPLDLPPQSDDPIDVIGSDGSVEEEPQGTDLLPT